MRSVLAAALVLGLTVAALLLASRWRSGDEARRDAVELSARDASSVSEAERVALEVSAPAPGTEPSSVGESTPEETPRVEAPVAAPEWVQEILRSTPESWKESHKGKSFDDRRSEREKILLFINAQSFAELERMREAKQWERISGPDPDGKLVYHGTKEDESLIYSTVMLRGDGIYKVVLPRERFPDLYTLKERANAIW